MKPDPVENAIRWDGVPVLRPLWEELARRMGASDRPVRRVRVVGLSDEARRKLASLFGWSRVPTKSSVSIDIAKLASQLGLDDPQLRIFIERVHGPIENRSAARRQESQRREEMWSRIDHRIGSRVPQTLARLRAAGVPGSDIDTHRAMLERLADVVERLPLSRKTPLPMLAWEVSGDPHGLDSDTACGRNLLVAAAELGGEEGEPDGIGARRFLHALGVVPDRLSTTVITYSLRAQPDTPLGHLLEIAADSRTPLTISGAALDSGSPRFENARWLCVENPSVVEALMLTEADIPVVCTAGWPATNIQRLLEMARSQGIELQYAGDYDSEGLAIASWMASRYEAKLLMSQELYLAADFSRSVPWRGDVPNLAWDRDLMNAIKEHSRIVYQEDPAIWRALTRDWDMGGY